MAGEVGAGRDEVGGDGDGGEAAGGGAHGEGGEAVWEEEDGGGSGDRRGEVDRGLV